jgi:hypothetical protein
MPLPADYIGAHRWNARSNNRVIQGSGLIHEIFTNPPAAVANGYSVAHAGAAAAGTRDMVLGGSLTSGGVGKPTFGRNVVITVTHASAVVAMSGTIYGTDVAGKPLEEAWAVTAGTVSKTFTGKKAFFTVSRITETIAATAAANTIVAGTGAVLGLLAKASVPSPVKEVFNGAVVTNGVLAKGSAVATEDPLGTYAPNTAPDGAHDYEVWYISDNPADS